MESIMRKNFPAIPEILNDHQNKPTISVEITPPKRGTGIQSIFELIDRIKDIPPLWIDVTSHPFDIQWIPEEDEQSFRPRRRRKSPGTIAICGAIEHKFGIPAVPHVLCKGFTREETEDALCDLDYLGVKNILAIRGDGDSNKPDKIGCSYNAYALDLIKQINDLNTGKWLDNEAQKTDFCIGTTCYPEKHFEAPNLMDCIEFLFQKQQAGAEYAVTQMFFNNQKFYAFMNAIQDRISMPIVPATKIITVPSHLNNIPKYFMVDIPPNLVEKVRATKTREQCIEVGVEWAYQQCIDLLDHGFNHFHFYIMQKAEPFMMLMEKLKPVMNKTRKTG